MPRTRSTRPKACGSWRRAACPSRCSGRSSATRATPACRARRRWPRRSSRWTSSAASWWPAPWCVPRGASRISRCPASRRSSRTRRSPAGVSREDVHPGRGRAGRAAGRAHRLRAGRAPPPRASPRARTSMTGPAADSLPQSVASAINRAAGGRPIPGNQVELLIDGPDAYAAMLDLIARASRWIHFENYIIRSDAEGWRFAEALAARAREGIQVRVLYDGMGSHAHLAEALAVSAPGRRRGPLLPSAPPAQPRHQLLARPPEAGGGRRRRSGDGRPLHRLRVDRGRRRGPPLAGHRGAHRRPGVRRARPGVRAHLVGRRDGASRRGGGGPGDARGRRRGAGDHAASRGGSGPSG